MVSKLSKKKYDLKILQTSGFGGLLAASTILQGKSLWVEGALTFNAPPPFKFYFFAPAIPFFTIITILQFIFICQYNQKRMVIITTNCTVLLLDCSLLGSLQSMKLQFQN